MYPVARCDTCDVIMTADVTTSALNASYSDNYYSNNQQKFSGGIDSLVRWFAARTTTAIVSTWRKRLQSVQFSPRVLDIGCGRGVFLRAFLDQGCDVMGLERPQFDIDPAIASSVKTASLSDGSLTKEKFDIIMLWHVLEHMDEPNELLETIAQHLNEGGLLVISVPNFSSWQARYFGPYWFHLDIPRHLFHFESNWLESRLIKAGFTIEQRRYADFVQTPFGFVQSLLNKVFPTRQNELYEMLKSNSRHYHWRFPLWLLAGTLLMPFAIVEMLANARSTNGATVTFTARLESK